MTLPYSLYKIASLVAAISFFIPIILVAIRNLFSKKLLLWFAIYWFWAGLINVLCSIEFIIDSPALSIIERSYNLLDIPFMLFIIYTTTEVAGIKKSLKKILLPFIIVGILVFAATRFNTGMESALVFCGVMLVLFYIIWTISYYSKHSTFKHSSISYQYIYYALLFEYATSIITVIYSYILPDRSNTDDVFFVFHLATIIAVATAAAGIFNYSDKKPVAKVKKSRYQPEAEIKYL